MNIVPIFWMKEVRKTYGDDKESGKASENEKNGQKQTETGM